jgi:chaperonin GroEL
MDKIIKYKLEARTKLKAGVDHLANAVKVTLGPSGRNVAYTEIDPSTGEKRNRITKDGVTVAKQIFLLDPIEDMGAQIVKEVAALTNALAGDGTTTATVLAQAIFNIGAQRVSEGMNPIHLKVQMEKTCDLIVEQLKFMATPVKDRLKEIATISANGDSEIGALVELALIEAGTNGITYVRDSGSMKTYVDITKGMEFDRGYLSPFFITDSGKMLVELEKPYILVTSDKIIHSDQILYLLEQLGTRSLLIIAEEISGEALNTLAVNSMRKTVKVCAINAPGFGELRQAYLQDIATLVGTYVQEGVYDFVELGDCENAIITSEKTTIAGGKGNIADRVAQLNKQIKNTEDETEKLSLMTRLAKLDGGVSIINVGAHSEVDMLEKKDRVNDALNATKAAIAEGVIPGGGSVLHNIGRVHLAPPDKNALTTFPVEPLTEGAKIVYEAIQAPMNTIKINMGMDPDDVLEIGPNVLDPVKVTRIALENAVSVASTLLTTECVITNA